MFQLYPKVISYNTRNSIIISLIAIALTIVIISYNMYILHYRKNRMLTQRDESKILDTLEIESCAKFFVKNPNFCNNKLIRKGEY